MVLLHKTCPVRLAEDAEKLPNLKKCSDSKCLLLHSYIFKKPRISTSICITLKSFPTSFLYLRVLRLFTKKHENTAEACRKRAPTVPTRRQDMTHRFSISPLDYVNNLGNADSIFVSLGPARRYMPCNFPE